MIMGIINMTPDSFTGDGLLDAQANLTERVDEMRRDGADIIDIGGESTRPGFVAVPPAEEIRRVLPAVKAAVRAGAVVSIDTRKAEVAEAAAREGATIINDVSSLSDDVMPCVAAAAGTYLVILHNARIDYTVGVGDSLKRGLERPIERALRAGVAQDRIFIDPGLGFGKTWRDNLAVVGNLRELRTFNLPILVGPSRKGTVSKVLGVKRDERLEGSLALVALCIAEGADAVRVHDIAPMKRAARMIDALLATEADREDTSGAGPDCIRS